MLTTKSLNPSNFLGAGVEQQRMVLPSTAIPAFWLQKEGGHSYVAYHLVMLKDGSRLGILAFSYTHQLEATQATVSTRNNRSNDGKILAW